MKIKFLGVGCGDTLESYHTCFVIENDGKYFLVDTGGGIQVRKQLRSLNIDLREIKDIFITHSHTDHILGLIWLFKILGIMKMHNEIEGKINLYCNDEVYVAIKEVSKYVLPEKLVEIIDDLINYVILRDGDKINIGGISYTFFDILAKDKKQYGFHFEYNNKKIVFLGDETIKPELYALVRDADFVMHEAFCLDSETDIFHPYEKNHSTALSAAKIMQELNVKNLLLYHTEDNLGEKRKEAYIREAKSIFEGNVLVPDDLEVIDF